MWAEARLQWVESWIWDEDEETWSRDKSFKRSWKGWRWLQQNVGRGECFRKEAAWVNVLCHPWHAPISNFLKLFWSVSSINFWMKIQFSNKKNGLCFKFMFIKKFLRNCQILFQRAILFYIWIWGRGQIKVLMFCAFWLC